MPCGTPKIDNTPLDPGGTALDEANPLGAPRGTPAGLALLGPQETSTVAPLSQGFVASLAGNVRQLFLPLGGENQGQGSLPNPRKRPRPGTPSGHGRAPTRPPLEGLEEAIIGYLATANGTIHAELAEVKTYIASLIEGLEQRLIGQLQALEHRINAYEANQTPQNALDYPTERLAPLETPQGLGNLPPPARGDVRGSCARTIR